MKRRTFAHACGAAAATLALGACEARSPAEAKAATPAEGAAAGKVSASQAYQLAAGGHGFSVGAVMAANTVYVFFDTACPHCAHLWAAAKPLAGRLKTVWMPVALLRSTSGPQGATILSAADPVAAMAENEASVLDRQSGIAVNPALGEEALAKVKANTELFARIGGDGVPLIVYRNARTGEHGIQSGATDTAGLASLVGV